MFLTFLIFILLKHRVHIMHNDFVRCTTTLSTEKIIKPLFKGLECVHRNPSRELRFIVYADWLIIDGLS